MKTIAVAGAIAALAMTTPVLAQSTNPNSADETTQAYARATGPAYTDGSAPATHPHDVVYDGRVVGRDPDPNIRFQLWREAPHAAGNGGDEGGE